MSRYPSRRVAIKRLTIALLLLIAVSAAVVIITPPSETVTPLEDSVHSLDKGGTPLREIQVESVEVKTVGPEEVVFDWSEDACETLDIPDIPVRAFRDALGRVHLISSHHVSRRMIGPSLDQLTHECDVIMRSDYEPSPSRFNDHEWISSVYTLDGMKIFALIHNEYQGHTHPDRCPSGEYRKCWYNSITLAASEDGGNTYQHAEPPTHLVASLPYRYSPDSGPMGVFGPSNIIYNAEDGYYYVLFRVEQYREQPWGTCVMRTQDLSDPRLWRAWNGNTFNVRFIDPYVEPSEHPKEHICQPVSRDEIGKMSRSVTFNTYLNQFLLISAVGGYESSQSELTAGIYYSLSDDLIYWSRRRLIMKVEMPWTYECGDPNPIEYPAVLDPESQSRNFETTGKQMYLYFTRFNYRSCRGTIDHDLIRIPIEFSKVQS